MPNKDPGRTPDGILKTRRYLALTMYTRHIILYNYPD